MSGRLRTELGLAKKRLNDALDLELDPIESFTDASPDDIYDEIINTVDNADTLRTEQERIHRLDKQWVELIERDETEKKTMEDYKKRLGDYMGVVAPVAQQLVLLEKRYKGLCDLHRAKSTSPEEYPVFDLSSTPVCTSTSDQPPNSINPSSTTISASAFDQPPNPVNPSSAPVHTSTSDQPPSYTNPPSTPGYASASNHPPSSANPSTTFTFTDKSAMATNRTTKLAMGQLLEFPTNRALGTPLDYSIGQAITHVPEPARLATADISGSMGSMAPLQFANVNSFQLTLPPIKLTTFNGNHLEYATFMDRFSSVIGNKPIEDVAKFQYLASALEGDAKSLIEFLPITSENYHIALSILKDNYGDTFRTRHYLLRQLQDLPSVAHSKNTKDINAFWTKATVALNQLRNIYPLCDNTTTADILIQKLPRFYISKIFISGQYQEFTASQLLQHVHRLIQADQLVSTVFNNNSNREERVTTMTTHTKSQQNHQTSKHQRQIPSKKGQSTPSTPCVFCASQESFHYHHDCPTYRTVNERHQRARNLQLCFKCLRHHDDFRSCTRVPKCRKCEGNHQTSFCKRNEPRNNTSPQSGNQQHLNQPRFNQGTPTPSTQPGQPFTPRQPQPSRSQQSNHPFNQRNGPNFRQNTQNTTNLATTEEYEPNHLESSFVATVSQHFPTITPASINFTNELDVQMFDSNAVESPKPVAMMATQLPIDNNDKTPVQSNILFDNGSDRSFISSELVKILKLPIDSKQSLRLQTFGNSDCKSIETNNFLVTFNLPAGKRSVMLTEIPFITTKLNCVQLSDSTVPKLMVSEQLDLPRIQSRPDILIGLDSMYQILGNTTSEILPNGMTMHQTDCGIIVTGRESTLEDQQYPDIDPYRNSINLTSSLHSHLPSGILQSSPEEEHKALQELLENFWTIDHVGSTDTTTTKDEEAALRFFLDTTTREADGRYTVRWPYKESSSDLPDNRFLAVFRLQSTLKKLEKDENLRMQYNNIIVDQLRRDFIEFVDDETICDGAVIHYLSHHPVIKTSSKTTKIRIVFDASAKINKSSQCLNDILYTGMSLLPQIPAVLLRVRCPVILQSGDIEKAFLQLGLDIRDRDACRFLWHFPDEDKPKCLRFKRVCFGVTSSPSLLTNTVKKHLRETNSHLSTDILKNIYVDNVFMGPPNVETGKMFYHESKRLFSSAMMNLTQFFSNSEELNNYIANEEKCSPEAAEQKILGVDWNTKHDQLGLKLPNPITSSQFTKRTILKTIASIYDPLGLLSPVTLLGKLFFQKLWLRTMDWDSPLTREEIIEWTSIENKWNGPGISFDRQYFQNPILPTDAFELHLFSDASEHAYGAVAYLRRLSGSTNEATIIFAKCRVSPVKKVYSIPQKELMGIEKAAQIGEFIIKEMELHFTNCYIWTDSLCSVDQLASNNANTIFSRNRLKKIKQFLPSAIISHVPGKLNPADLISRGCSLEELRSNEIWWKGPQFLQSQDPLPIRESSLQQAICNLSITTPAPVEPLIDPERFNSFYKMLNIIMMVLLFPTKLLKRTCDPDTLRERAKLIIIKIAQATSPPTEDTIQNLHLQWKKDVWFFDGRQPNHTIPFLPDGSIARLLILEIHRKHHHSSTLYTLAKLRQEVWIPRGMSVVKKSLRSCLHCKRNAARPFYQPDFPPLPDMRVNWTSPFTNVGMDYCGPIKAKSFDDTRKYYFLLFTCLTSRFTTVELVASMDSATLLNALRRVAAQYGPPQLIYTDNAAQIKLLEKVVSEARNQQQRLLFNSNDLPTFKYIPALSPWSGGIYERVVGILKRCLIQAGTTRSLLTEDDLRTLMKEAESIINDRPLTVSTSDMDDLHPLTPSHFVNPNKQRRNLLNIEETLDTLPLPTTQASLLDDWMRLSSISRQFISRWKTEYLQMLQGRVQWQHQQDHLNIQEIPNVGDIVLIEESGQFGKSRIQWPLAKIVKVGTRSAHLFNSRTKEVVERPFRKLIPLEISSDLTSTSQPSTTTNDSATPTSNSNINQQQHTDMPISSRTRNKMMTSLAVTLAVLLTLTSVQSTSCENSSISPNVTETSTQSIGINIEDAYIVSTSLLREIVSRLGYTVILIGLLATVYIISIMIHVSSKLIILGSCILRTSKAAFLYVWKIICIPFNRYQSSITAARSSIFMIILIFYMISPTTGCHEIAHVSGKDAVCYNHDNSSQECIINTVSLITLRTMGTQSCLEFHIPAENKDKNHTEVLISLKVEAEAIIMKCNKDVVFYSRDNELELEFVQRCDSAGSCTIDKCTNIKTDEDLPELSIRARSSPGFTSCVSGCGCINCGCFYCGPSCLFYRYYAQPTTDIIYEISRCTTWSPKIRLEIILNNDTIVQELLPGIKSQLPGTNLSITAVNLDQPPMQIHQATFISAYEHGRIKKHSFSYTQPSAPGVPTKGLIGELHCATWKDADNFNCNFDPNLCRCVGFATKVACNCDQRKVSEFESEKLPYQAERWTVLFDKEERTIIVETTEDSIVTLEVEAKDATVNRQTTITKCIASQVEQLQGCYNCDHGATTTIACESRSITKALLNCPNSKDYINCGPETINTEIRMLLSSDDLTGLNSIPVWINCTVDCGVKTSILLEGTLEFRPKYIAHEEKSLKVFESIAEAVPVLSMVVNWFYDVVIKNFTYFGYSMLILVLGVCCIFRMANRRQREIHLRFERPIHRRQRRKLL